MDHVPPTDRRSPEAYRPYLDTLARLRPHGAELVGEVIDYGTSYRLCYLHGPGGMIVELAERLS